MKDVTMRKSTFVKGAMITTIGIVLTKVMGILYVVPFYGVIGEKGGALYGYAYTIYTLFMSLASAGIPLAISKLVSEYQTLGFYNAKQRVFYLGRKIALLLGFICFIIILLFAPYLAKEVLGGVVGGNTIEDVTFVIRVIGTAVLIVPILSIYRGYFEGHRLFSPPSISQVLEQFVRVSVIIFGSFSAVRVFHLSIASGVGIALLGATLGAFVSYLYLVEKRIKNKRKFQEKIRKVNEPKIEDKIIIQKLFYYAIPFILIDIFKSLYSTIDMLTVVKALVKYADFVAVDAETIYSIFSTWGQKFNMIIIAISTGVVVSLIPTLTESVVKKDQKDIQKKITQALSILLFFTIPMTFGISFLSKPIWLLFYGESAYGANVLSYYVFVGLFTGLYTSMVSTLQTLKDYKMVFISLVSGVLIKLIFNIYLLKTFNDLSFPAYYGPITASVLGYLFSFFICLFFLKRKYSINFEDTLNHFIDIMCASILMIFILYVFRLFVPLTFSNRCLHILSIAFYTGIGCVVFFLYTHKTKTFQKIFGTDLISFLKRFIH